MIALPWTDHLIVAPIILPLAASGLMLLIKERHIRAKRAIAAVTISAMLAIALVLLHGAATAPAGGGAAIRTYLLGNWPAPFGIVLVLDRLSALMLAITSLLGFTSSLYATARWDQAGPRFHALLLLQLMGINGAFLTGDLFNLFVFFEVLLAASYGLLLHGSSTPRIKAALHYIAINVATSLLFLIGMGLIYAATGTLNMAHLAVRIHAIPDGDRMILDAGAAILGLAFLVKAGMWPLSFWLPKAYSAASAPVAALFAILSKVGIYAVLRVSLLVFTPGISSDAYFASFWLLFGGLATIAFATIGVLSSKTLSGIAAYSLMISSGTLLATIGARDGAVVAGALFYLVSSTLGVSAFYLLIELVQRGEIDDDALAPVTEPVFDDEYTGAVEGSDDAEIGVVIPGTIALLGGGFMFCALVLAGMPPLSGFISKFAIINGLLGSSGAIPMSTWILLTLMIVSGLAILVATTRAGIDYIWTPSNQAQAPLRISEAIPVGVLVAVCLGLLVFAAPVMRYMEQTTRSLADRSNYSSTILQAPRVQSAGDPL
ncbi:monovalent cation/H+ antiporter subunit D [Croceibacterium ferulae]|uniref:monovalent cation/H+ antiporter subunit D n=1 Tax=Croceibacterium ferulae TaxID=1854641 RepID=UPI001F4D5415|nr:monovalent cation/H+ antiporter subunit D [Croceibacterium ferulae]